MENATSMLLFGVTYLIIFGILIGITGQGSLDFSITEIITMILISGGASVTAAVVASVAAESIPTIAGGGEAIWKGAMFAMVASWASFFVYKLVELMPAGVPWEISALFLGPPVVGILWGMFAVFMGGKG